MMFVPTKPKIYHIVHVDRLPSIISGGRLWPDAMMVHRDAAGISIGISSIKERRRTLPLTNHPELQVGGCVPFYFCPRSVMLYVIHMGNHPELAYRGGQEPIVHLEADLRRTVAWANSNSLRWAFTSSNAGSRYFEDYSDLAQLDKIDWDAAQANNWAGERKEPKQAEFLIESSFPWELVSRVGIESQRIYGRVRGALSKSCHRPTVAIRPDWYY